MANGDIPFGGFLSDRRLLAKLKIGELLEKGSWDEGCVRESSYLARLGRTAKIFRATDNEETQTREFTEVHLVHDSSLKIGPGDTALLSFKERFHLPPNFMALTIPRGLLYAEALSPAVSYVDPGYNGDFYMPVTNMSNRDIELPTNLELARVFFFELSDTVEAEYSVAKSEDLAQELKSIPTIHRASADELEHSKDSQLLDVISGSQGAGREIAEMLQRSRAIGLEGLRKQTSRRLVSLGIFAVGWPLVLAVAASSTWRHRLHFMRSFPEIAGSVLTLVLVSLVVQILLKKYDERSKKH